MASWKIGFLVVTLLGTMTALRLFLMDRRFSNLRVYWEKLSTGSLFLKPEPRDYFHWRNTGSCRLYFEFGGRVYRPNSNSSRVAIDGQKAVCLHSGLAPPSGLCIIYSFSHSSNNWLFEEVMESYGCDVYGFDPSTQRNYRPRFPHLRFFNFGLGSRKNMHNQKGKTKRFK